MIRLITGVTRLDGRVLRPSDGAFEASPITEAYLVGRGVAEYVNGAAKAVPEADVPEEVPEEVSEEAPAIEAEAPKKATPKSRKR